MQLNAQKTKPSVIMVPGFMVAISLASVAQEQRSEGSGILTKESAGNGTLDRGTNAGGLLVGYRYTVKSLVRA